MRVLGLDTSTAIASAGLAIDGLPLLERHRAVASSHARSVLPLVDEVLDAAGLRLADVDRLAVSIGPGSFTGLRIGLATIKGLALGCGLPVTGVPTLEAFARALGPRRGTIWPLLDARKGEVYAAAYRWSDQDLEEISAPAVVTPADLVGRLASPSTLIGDGADAYADLWPAGEYIERIPLADLAPNGATVATVGSGCAVVAPHELEPRYYRPSEAEVRRQRAVATAVSAR